MGRGRMLVLLGLLKKHQLVMINIGAALSL